MIPLQSFALPQTGATRQRTPVFVSYHHRNDQQYYEQFRQLFVESLQLVSDHSLKAPIPGDSSAYILERIRHQCISAARCTIVLCGRETRSRRYVDWEIHYSLAQGNGLIGVLLPDAPAGRNAYPDLLWQNACSGFAPCIAWPVLAASPHALALLIDDALSRPPRFLRNTRPSLLP
jgi:hypothetical protein